MIVANNDPRGEVLVALLPSKSDFGILLEQGWYRIPVRTAPKRWPPKWLAFYQPKAFGVDAYRIRYYGEVSNIDVAKRYELFPSDVSDREPDHEYFKINLESLKELNSPILSHRPRRLLFVPTTWQKFSLADQINDLFDGSPLEDLLWKRMKMLYQGTERQWFLKPGSLYYWLDFALFCKNGFIDIETDGDTWHSKRDRIAKDNQRDNDLASIGWYVLRFNGKQIRESLEHECLPIIRTTIDNLGGLSDELLGEKVRDLSDVGIPQVRVLREQSQSYMLDSGARLFEYIFHFSGGNHGRQQQISGNKVVLSGVQ